MSQYLVKRYELPSDGPNWQLVKADSPKEAALKFLEFERLHEGATLTVTVLSCSLTFDGDCTIMLPRLTIVPPPQSRKACVDGIS